MKSNKKVIVISLLACATVFIAAKLMFPDMKNNELTQNAKNKSPISGDSQPYNNSKQVVKVASDSPEQATSLKDSILELKDDRTSNPFADEDIVWNYEKFLSDFNSLDSLSEDELQAFFTRINDSINSSENARQIVADIYRGFPIDDHTSRMLTSEMLMNSNTGRGILSDEAYYQLGEGPEAAHSEAFRLLANVGRDTVNYKAIEKAAYHIGQDTSEGNMINALGFIGEVVERNKETISPVHFGVVVKTLKDAVTRRSDDQQIQTMAAQKLYYITEPNNSAALANEFLINSPSSTLVVETMYAMDQGHILRGSELENNLRNALTRSDVTELEIGIAKELLPELVPSGY